MQVFYQIFILIAIGLLRIVGLFQLKVNKFLQGRKNVFKHLQQQLQDNESYIWIHSASLGEFEQGRPIIEKLKAQYQNHKILLTFFSPSGYDVRKDYELADLVFYLPIDTYWNAKRFIKMVNPTMAIFIKYEFWPNYLSQLQKNNIRAILISGIFRKDQLFFKWYGKWFAKKLKAIQYFFVQDKISQDLLSSIGITNVTIAGDTRFDRVQGLLEKNEELSFVKIFTNNEHTIVAGSTWPDDEELLVDYINHYSPLDEKIIIAPHNINAETINDLIEKLHHETVLFSEMNHRDLKNHKVFIVDTIGLLSKIYKYASVAYIGGGYNKSGVHNTLEAATYGLPIVIGPNYQKFKEVKDLVNLGGVITTHNAESLTRCFLNLYESSKDREQMAFVTKQYVQQNIGATNVIMTYLKKYL